MTIISAYTPTLVSLEETKEDFYESLDKVVQCIPAADKIALLSDFNAHIGKNSEVWQGVIGKHGIGKMNSNGLTSFYSAQNINCASPILCFNSQIS